MAAYIKRTIYIFLILALGFGALAPAGITASAQEQESIPIYLAAVGAFDPLVAEPDVAAAFSTEAPRRALVEPYLVQLEGPVLEEWKIAIQSAGGRLGPYVPDFTFVVGLDGASLAAVQRLPFVRWVGPYRPAYKVSPEERDATPRSYRVYLAPWADAQERLQEVQAMDAQARGFDNQLSAVLDARQLDSLLMEPGVLWVEPYHLQRLYNDVGGATIMRAGVAWANGYTGSGVTVAVADTGLDTGNPAAIHADFAGRVSHIASWPVVYANYSGCSVSNVGADDGPADTASGHGTHVTGSVAGDGADSAGVIKGLSYQANIVFQAVEQNTTWSPSGCAANGNYLTGIPDDVRLLLQQAYDWGARVHNDSWGGGDPGEYDQQASLFDDFIFKHPDMTVLAAAGNDGTDANANGYVDENSISSPASAKNLITIGATDNERAVGGYAGYSWYEGWPSDYQVNPTRDDLISDSREEMAAFSSRGPLNDGRLKPDLVAPGTNILSTRSSLASSTGWGPYDAYYMYMGGTSMASPLSAGAAGLVRDYYNTAESLANPSAALIKATLINSAVDITGYGNTSQEAGQPIPNNHEGWGRIDVGAATSPGKRMFDDHTAGLKTNGNQTYTYYAKAGQPFKVTLVWSDYPGQPYAGKALVNNLDLKVTAPGGQVYLGNVFAGGWSTTGGSADNLNNVENVYIQSPAAGVWKVEVLGGNIPSGPQPYAMVVNGDITTVAPLTVTGINPAMAPNNAVLTGAKIDGTGFVDGASVQIVNGAVTVNGTGIVVAASGNQITANFDLDGLTPAKWDVKVTLPDARTATLVDGLQVLDSTLPNLRVVKTTVQETVDSGGTMTYTIRIDNNGYVPVGGVIFTDTLPAGMAFQSLSPACSAGPVAFNGGFSCATEPPTLTVGAKVTYSLVVKLAEDARGSLTNHVEVSGGGEELFTGDNVSESTVVVGLSNIYLPLIRKNWPPLPAAPILQPISNPESDGQYVLTWQPGAGVPATSYDIEEDAQVIVTGHPDLSYTVPGRLAGTYVYRVRGRNSYGAGPWSNAQSVVVTVSSAILLPNGDFELGRDGTWAEVSSHGFDLVYHADQYSPPAHSGAWLGWLGGYISEISSLSQTVVVPPGARLSFYHLIGSNDAACGHDYAYVRANSTPVATFNLCTQQNTTGWREVTVDLSAYGGQSVALEFYAFNDGVDSSHWFLDDIAFK